MAPAHIGTLWIGPALGWLERLCLTSFVDQGHEVTVFGYDEIADLPAGVRFESADRIFSTDRILRHAKSGSPALLSDRFRYRMLAECPGMIWADTDAYCLRPFETETGYFFGWQSKKHINGGVLGLPPDSPALAALLDFTEDDYPIPPFYAPDRRAALQARAEAGAPVHARDLPWGVWGPDALTHFLTETGEAAHAFPPSVLYPIPFKRTGTLIHPRRRVEAEAMIGPETKSIHFWGRRFRNMLERLDGVPPDGGLARHLLDRHGISLDADGQAAPGAPSPGRPRPDFSMFEVEDVANMLLQRSEAAPVGPAIRAWSAGDPAPLMAHAERLRAPVLDAVFRIAEDNAATLAEALDARPPRRLADIGCGYAMVDLALCRRYGCDIVLIDIETNAHRHFGFAEEGAAYTNLAKARDFLLANGVPPEKVTAINPTRDDVSAVAAPDALISLASCGFHYPVTTYDDLIGRTVAQSGTVILDIRRSSGGIHALKRFGDTEVLREARKFRTVVLRPAEALAAAAQPAAGDRKPAA